MLKCLEKCLKRAHILSFPRVSIVQTMSTVESETQNKPFILKRARYDGRSKKRKWEERRSDKGEGLFPQEKKVCVENSEPFIRVKRKKYAMLLGYSGVNYLGMQRNPTTKTIEEELFKALLKTNHITQEAFEQIQTISFQRAARTDKGVSAVRQIVSMKLPEEVNIEQINDSLPEDITVFGTKRVTKGFNSKVNCDSRTYIYMLPTIAFSKTNDTQSTFRLSEDKRQEINNVLGKFKGTKNFHNFTIKKLSKDPSALRYIMSFECEPPFIRNNVEFAILKVRGQSFMLHQIRKMVGLTIAVVKGYIKEDLFDKALTEVKINIPKAPGLGLMLDFVHYERYDNRYGQDGVHETLTWSEFDQDVHVFRDKYILPTIINTEINDAPMMSWLAERLSLHDFEDLGKIENEKSSDDECEDDEKEENEDLPEDQIEEESKNTEVIENASETKNQTIENSQSTFRQ